MQTQTEADRRFLELVQTSLQASAKEAERLAQVIQELHLCGLIPRNLQRQRSCCRSCLCWTAPAMLELVIAPLLQKDNLFIHAIP